MARRVAPAAIVALVVADTPHPAAAGSPQWAVTDLGPLGGEGLVSIGSSARSPR